HHLCRGFWGQLAFFRQYFLEVSEVLDVEVRGEGVEHDHWLVARVLERVRDAWGDHHQGSLRGFVGRVAHGEAGRSGDHVEAFVVLGVAVLDRAWAVWGQGDLSYAQAVVRGVAVFQDSHPGRAQFDHFAFVRGYH